MLTESALLAAGGAVVGLVVASWLVPALVALAPTRLPRIVTVGIDLRVLIFAVAVSGVTRFSVLPCPRCSGPRVRRSTPCVAAD
jgi:hypothetical protein